jgi:hypothetical protein
VVGTPVRSFTGFVPITPAEINLRHQLALVPTIDRKFGKVTVNAGGGAGLFNVHTKFINAWALHDRRDRGQCQTVSFSNDDWVWGGVAQVGATYAAWPPLVLGSWLHPCAIAGVQDQRLGFSNRTDRLRAAVSPSRTQPAD